MTNQAHKTSVLFLCTGNSCRSQMAEGWAKKLHRNHLDVYSAGTETHGLNPSAVKVMHEVGIDMSKQISQKLDEFDNIPIDYVVTVCPHAHETCPAFPGKATVLHHGFDDPPKLARSAKTEEESLSHYRRVRDDIRAFVETLPAWLQTNCSDG